MYRQIILYEVLVTALALCTVIFAFGQSTFKKNTVYVEAGGNGLLGAVNYERQLTNKPGLGARIGVGFYTDTTFCLTLPAGINYVFKLKGEKSFIDAGLGATWSRIDTRLFAKSDNQKYLVYVVPSIGYRRHTVNNVMWRVSVTPFVYQYGLVPWVGASIGKRF